MLKDYFCCCNVAKLFGYVASNINKEIMICRLTWYWNSKDKIPAFLSRSNKRGFKECRFEYNIIAHHFRYVLKLMYHYLNPYILFMLMCTIIIIEECIISETHFTLLTKVTALSRACRRISFIFLVIKTYYPDSMLSSIYVPFIVRWSTLTFINTTTLGKCRFSCMYRFALK